HRPGLALIWRKRNFESPSTCPATGGAGTDFDSAKYLRENSRTCSNKLFIARAKNGTPGGPSLRVCPPGNDADPPNPPPPAAGCWPVSRHPPQWGQHEPWSS